MQEAVALTRMSTHLLSNDAVIRRMASGAHRAK
jgi:hypothetical protein